jgi:hypothetical protein
VTRYLLWCVVILLLPSAALAQSTTILVPNPLARSNPDAAVTITSTHAVVVPAGTYGFVEISSQDQGNFFYCVWGGTSVAAATAGQRSFPPLSGYVWDASNPAPSGKALDCISSAASSPVTVRYY